MFFLWALALLVATSTHGCGDSMPTAESPPQKASSQSATPAATPWKAMNKIKLTWYDDKKNERCRVVESDETLRTVSQWMTKHQTSLETTTGMAPQLAVGGYPRLWVRDNHTRKVYHILHAVPDDAGRPKYKAESKVMFSKQDISRLIQIFREKGRPCEPDEIPR